MANLFDFSAEFEGVDQAIQEQTGAVYNEPDPFVIPSSRNTTSVVESFGAENFVPTGSLSPYLVDEAAQAQVDESFIQEAEGLNAQQSAFSPSLVSPTTKEPVYTVEVRGTAPAQQPLVNPLHDFESYTYNLSLHAITIENFNNLTDSPRGYIPTDVLIAGAGRYSDNFKRNRFFEEDFYFENLRLESIVNTKKTNRFSNVVNIEFTIIEPGGFTLIQRLISACELPRSQGGVGGQNYLKQPFILQIDFYGQVDGNIGAGIIPNQTKLIPIKLVSMNTKIGTKGTQYDFEAVPYNHNAFDPTKINLPANFTVKAAKVYDIFGDGEVTTESTAESQALQDQIEARNNYSETYGAALTEDNEGAAAVLANQGIYQTKVTQTLGKTGIAAGFNSYYKTLEEKNNLKYDRIKFSLDPEIGDSLIYTSGPTSISNAAETGSTETAAQQAGGANKGTIAFNAGQLTIPAGTNIQSVIEWAITNSEYMSKQIIGVQGAGDPSKGVVNQSAEILKLVKIVPRVKIREYDPTRANYSYDITYIIRKFLVNSRTPNAPQGRVQGWVKEYNYIYTGGVSPYTGDVAVNRDVINLDLDFNMLFYTAITGFREKNKLFTTGATQANGADDLQTILNENASGFEGDPGNTPSTQTTNPAKALEDLVERAEVVYQSGSKRNQTRTGAGQAGVQASADILNNQLSDARGDMINVSLTITGDPHWIKQDDILYNQNLVGQTSRLTPNNSLYTDSGELYVYLNFMSPVDYDESTGLAIPFGSSYNYSLFSGVYKVITVTSTFRGGEFRQILELIRLPISDQNRLKEAQSAYRQAYGFEIGTGQGVAFQTSQLAGQRIFGTILSGALLNGGAGLESLAAAATKKVFGEVQNIVAKEIGRLTSDIFDSSIADDAADALSSINFDDIGGVNATFQDLGTDLVNSLDFLDVEVGDPTQFTSDVDFLGDWL